jgi:hypothetical protein
MPRKTRRGGRAVPQGNADIIELAPPHEHEEYNVVDEILSIVSDLDQEEKDRLYQEAYEHGDLGELQPDPNASSQYNHIAQLVAGLTEDDLEELTERLGSVLQGGRRRRSKLRKTKRRKTKKTKKTRKYRR